MSKKRVILGALGVLLVIAVVFVGLFVAFSNQQPATPGQSLQFNGQTLDLAGAHSVEIHSSNTVTAYGAVTVTTSSVTVTIWTKGE